jgi:hypothetical protein
MDDAQQRRAAKNEATSREVNEAIKAHSPGERRSPAVFLCECSRAECDHFIEITPRDYERMRSDPRRFAVHPGHEQPEIETVVDTLEGYLIVEKEDAAGHLAEAKDPRD